MECLLVTLLAVSFAVIAWLIIFIVWRSKKIAELCLYLSRMTNGDWSLDIRSNKEGQLSILKNELYKVTHALTEQAAVLQNDKLELANALSDISHQLKTPLTSLGVMTDLLDDDKLPPERRCEFIASIRASQRRMEWLVLSLLKIAKLDANAAELKKGHIAMSVLIDRSLAPMLIPMEIKEQSYTVDGQGEIIVCDPDWTAEALGNIIKNAVENTPQGGHIAISCGQNPLYSFIAVCNSGNGIAKSDLPHLFKRFYRGANAASDSIGIGLAMSLTIMQKQNGDIEAASNNGSVFTLKFYK